jgi:outer membrane protein
MMGAAAIGATLVVFAPHWLAAQQPLPNAPRPNVPTPNLIAAADGEQTMPPGQMAAQQNPPTNGEAPAAMSGPQLTVEEAEQMALKNNPNISVARLLALAQGQVTREARSAEMPQAAADFDAVGSHDGSRITGGGSLNSPRVLNKAAAGLSISQLITDFGRTHNLVKSAQSNARAELENEKATELDIRLAVDQAFYQALTSQAVLKVAQQTVAQRQAIGDQVSALTKSKMRSDLDLSFANVQIAQAKLLLLDAENSEASALAALNAVLGSDQDLQYVLVDETHGAPAPAPTDPEAMVQQAFQQRPDLASLNDRYLAAKQYATAEHDQLFPTISAMTAGGGAPVRSDLITTSWYFGAGANINVPVFNGFLYSAESKEAKYRAGAAQEEVRNLRNNVARDVRTAVLNAQTAFQRIGVTEGELNQANLALDLAQARYKIGLSSIVELTQAQLAQTQAEIDNTNAMYSYQTALAEVRYEVGQ